MYAEYTRPQLTFLALVPCTWYPEKAMHDYLPVLPPGFYKNIKQSTSCVKTLQFCGRIFFALKFVRAILRESVFSIKELNPEVCSLMVFHMSNLFKTKDFKFLKNNWTDFFLILAKLPNIWHTFDHKGTEFLQQTQIVNFLYLYNLMVKTFDISNLDYLI